MPMYVVSANADLELEDLVPDEFVTRGLVTRTFVDVVAIGDTQLVTAQGVGIAIRVLALVVLASVAVTARLKGAGNNLSAAFALAVSTPLILPYTSKGWYQTGFNKALNFNQGLAVATGVQVIWMAVQ